MKYQALARTWRPKSFSEMIGQEHVVKALSNALEKQRIHHAYLFTGTRGVGKTTVARIFAKALNCETGPSATPCGKCSSCLEIDSGNQVDLIEVDAASRTGVEQTRELLDNVQYRPVSSRFKIYLIDEVHMFSTSSFNALLKTLEEPPEHVKFLLATTDPKKCPITVLSRCLQFNLHPLAYGKIASHLETILTKDEIAFEKPAINIIAQAANGSIRDSLSLLDQAISYSPDNIKESDVVKMLGAASVTSIIELATFVANNQATDCLTIVNKLAQSSVNFIDALDQLISLYHQLAIFLVTGICEDDNVKSQIESLANILTAEEIQLNYQILLDGKRDFLLSNNSQSGFEMLILRLIAFRPADASLTGAETVPKKIVSQKTTQNNQRIESIIDETAQQGVDKQIGKVNEAVKPIVTKEPMVQETPAQIKSFELKTDTTSYDINADNWHIVVANLGLKAIAKQLASNCVFYSLINHVITLHLPNHFSILLNDDIHQKLEVALKNYSTDVKQLVIEEANKEQTSLSTPAEINHQSDMNHQENLKQSFLSDPVVQSLQQDMDARLIPDSIHEIEITEENT